MFLNLINVPLLNKETSFAIGSERFSSQRDCSRVSQRVVPRNSAVVCVEQDRDKERWCRWVGGLQFVRRSVTRLPTALPVTSGTHQDIRLRPQGQVYSRRSSYFVLPPLSDTRSKGKKNVNIFTLCYALKVFIQLPVSSEHLIFNHQTWNVVVFSLVTTIRHLSLTT